MKPSANAGVLDASAQLSTLQSQGERLDIPSPRVPYELCWIILEEQLGSYSTKLEREAFDSSRNGKNSPQNVTVLTGFKFQRVDQKRAIASYVCVNHAFYDILRTIMGTLRLVYDRHLHQSHIPAWQMIAMGRTIVIQLQEVVFAHSSFTDYNHPFKGHIDESVRAVLAVLMEDRGLPFLLAALENEQHLTIGVLVIQRASDFEAVGG